MYRFLLDPAAKLSGAIRSSMSWYQSLLQSGANGTEAALLSQSQEGPIGHLRSSQLRTDLFHFELHL